MSCECRLFLRISPFEATVVAQRLPLTGANRTLKSSALAMAGERLASGAAAELGGRLGEWQVRQSFFHSFANSSISNGRQSNIAKWGCLACLTHAD